MLPISSFKIPQTSNTSTRSNLLTQIDAPHEQANGEGQSIVQASENCVVSNQLYGESHTVTTNFFLTASDSNTKLIFEKLNGHAEASRYKPLAQLGTHIEDLRAAYLNVLEEVDEIRDGLTLYIPSEGQETADSKITFTLIDKVREFLSSKKKVLLLLGEAGSGKSTFNRDLTRTLWVEYQQSPAAPIPIFIALAEHTPSCKDLIESYLLEQKFSPEEIAVLRKEKRLVFILDGFDEIKDRMQAFYTQNKLDHWNNAQVIISSRPEYLGHGYRSQFQKRGQTSALQEYWISPISGDWMAAYIKNYIQHAERAEWSFERYQAALDSWPALKESIRRPFLLKMTLELLPSLTESKSTAPITRIALYDEFISRWWSRSEERLHHIELTDKEREVFKRLNEENFLAHGIKFSQDLAIGLHRAQAVVVMYSEAVDGKREDDWRKEFLGNSEKARLLRFNAPLIRQGDQYWFIHKSIQDYCVARAICGPQFNSAQPAINAVLNRFLVVDEPLILDFLAERVKQYPSFKAHLHAWIESSKNPNTPVTVGAANAITILVRAGIQFNGADLNGVRIPGADLSYGVFDSAQLQGSDLRGVNLRTSWLREANLSGAQMADVQFGEWPYLEEDSNVESCAYSPDGENYVVGLANGKIRVYWTSNWEKMHTLKGHTNVIGSVMYSPSGLQLASGSDDKTVRLWDPRSGALLHTLEGHTGWVTSMVYSPSGLQLASGSDDKTVRLWDTQIGALFRTLDGHTSRVNSVVYSLSGLQLASGSDDKTVRLWDTQNGALFRTLEGHTREIKSVLYSPSGLQLASECKGHTVLLWDPQSGALVHTLEGYTGSVKLLYSTNVSSMAYSPSGLQLALGGDDNAIRLWDSQSGALVHTLKGHTSSVNSVTYSPNGLQLASGGDDNAIRLWDSQSGALVHTLKGHTSSVSSVAYSPSGLQLASRGENLMSQADNMVRLWEVQSRVLAYALEGHTSSVNSVAYSPSGEQIASGSWDNTVQLWDAHSGALVHALEGYINVSGVVYSPSGLQLASVNGYEVQVCDLQSGALVHTLEGHRYAVTSVAYSPSGEQIASGSYDNTIRLWDAYSGELVHTLENHTGGVTSVAYSPSGLQLASGSDSETVRIWDLQSGALVYTLEGYGNRITYSPSGSHLALWGRKLDGRAVRIWDLQSGAEVRTLDGHTSSVKSVVYSPSGLQLASGSYDKTVRLWEAASGECLRIIDGFNWGFNSVGWKGKHEESYLLTGSDDGVVRQWSIKKEVEGYKVQLDWTSWHKELNVRGILVDGVKGLSEKNKRLLEQRGKPGYWDLEGDDEFSFESGGVSEIFLEGDSDGLLSKSDKLYEISSEKEGLVESDTNCYSEKLSQNASNLASMSIQESLDLNVEDINCIQSEFWADLEQGKQSGFFSSLTGNELLLSSAEPDGIWPEGELVEEEIPDAEFPSKKRAHSISSISLGINRKKGREDDSSF